MERFESYLLAESLNSPQEFYLTDDTEMPKRVFGAFSVNGKPYIMALTESNVEGVYMFEVGRTKEGASKVYWWKYHNPKDMFPVLSTLLKFIESSIQFVGKQRIKAVNIRLRGAQAKNIDRAVKIAKKMIKKTYIQSFILHDVAQPKEGEMKNNDRYIFLTNKGVNPKSLFKSTTYKAYDFDKEQVIASELENKKVMKATFTTKPSSKYHFKGLFDVDLSTSAEVDKALDSIKEIIKDDKEKEKKEKKEPTKPALGVDFLTAFLVNSHDFKNMVNSLKKNGFDGAKYNHSDFNYVLKSAVKPYSVEVQSEITKALSKENVTKGILGAISEGETGYNTTKFVDIFSKLIIYYKDVKKNKTSDKDFFGEKIDVSDLNKSIQFEGFGDGVYPDTLEYTPYFRSAENHDQYQLYQNIKSWASEKQYPAIKKSGAFQKIKNYTGAKSFTYNNKLRNAVYSFFEIKGYHENKEYPIENLKNSTDVQKMANAFDKMEPIDQPLWVYRGFTIDDPSKIDLEEGKDFIEPGFMSTSVTSESSFSGNVKMRIYVPKGSKICPILNLSKHPSEKEVILPPCSIIRIVEKIANNENDRLLYTGIYVGNVYKSLYEAMMKELKEGYNVDEAFERILMEEKEKPNKDKFSSEINPDAQKKILDYLKKNNLKVEKPIKK